MNGLDETEVKEDTGCDTFFSEGSLPAALRAAGAVCNAVDRIVKGCNSNAFCVVRPPGHHAGTTGLLQDAVSCGFCIFNNVAIAAQYALKAYPNKIKRVAIIDIDVHYGNGTEEIIQSKFKVLYIFLVDDIVVN
jgi:acetoin utilization deacetylase AcuC-like enzyme